MTALDLRRVPVELRLHQPRPRLVAAGVGSGIVLLPLLRPSGPGNTGIADVGIALAILVVLGVAYRNGDTVRLPYVVAWGAVMVAGALAAVLAGSGGSTLAVLQDAVVLAWGAAVANACRTAGVLTALARAWVVSAVGWAGLLLVSYVAGISALSGVTSQDGGRASSTFNDPNLAGNYFVTSLFVLLACRYPRRAALRWPAMALLLSAVALTGSNGALLSLALGLCAGAVIGVRRRHGAVAGLLVASLLGAVAIVGQTHLDLRAVQARAADSIPLLRDSVGRSGESSAERGALLAEGEALYWRGNLAGIGPGNTKRALTTQDAPYVKEAHDDYLATLVERGVLGGVGLLLLVATTATKLGRVIGRPLRADYAAAVPRPEFLAAACLAMVLSAGFYEVLHFRHLWALLGLVAGLDRWGRRP